MFLSDHWRRCVRQVAGHRWQEHGWVVFGVDGSTFDSPRSAANEQTLGRGGRHNGPPQQLVTCLYHVASGLLWAWVRGSIKQNSERGQLRQMLPLLPKNALVLGDAGFHGYDLVQLCLNQGTSFLLRVGNNVRLITRLGYATRERKNTVYLWPLPKQKRSNQKQQRKRIAGMQPPLVLRLIRLKDAKGRPVCLLTNVLEKSRLSDPAAQRMYRLRWGIEVMWRDLKQTMSHYKMLSDSPGHAASELDWALAGLWMLQLISVRRQMECRRVPRCYSPAESLRVLRCAMNGRRSSRRSLRTELAEAVKDEYRRHSVKKARWCRSKRNPVRPPGIPVARMATATEKRLARLILNHSPPKSLAA